MAKLVRKLLVYLVLLLAVEGLAVLVGGLCNRLQLHKAFFTGVGETLWIANLVIASQLLAGWIRPKLGLRKPSKAPSAGAEPPPV